MTQRRAQLPDTLTEPPFDLDGTGRDLYAATAPLAWADPATDFAWAKYTDALGELLDVIAEMVRDDADGNAGWTALASPARCPNRSCGSSRSGPGSAAGTRSPPTTCAT